MAPAILDSDDQEILEEWRLARRVAAAIEVVGDVRISLGRRLCRAAICAVQNHRIEGLTAAEVVGRREGDGGTAGGVKGDWSNLMGRDFGVVEEGRPVQVDLEVVVDAEASIDSPDPGQD